MDSCIIAVLVICSLTAPALGDKGTSKARSCSDIRLFYRGKGFAPDGVPASEISGKPSRVHFLPLQIQLNARLKFQGRIEGKVCSTRWSCWGTIVWPQVPKGMLVYFEAKVAPAVGGIYCLQWVLLVNTCAWRRFVISFEIYAQPN